MDPIREIGSPGFNETAFSAVSAKSDNHVPDQISSPQGPVLSLFGKHEFGSYLFICIVHPPSYLKDFIVETILELLVCL